MQRGMRRMASSRRWPKIHDFPVARPHTITRFRGDSTLQRSCILLTGMLISMTGYELRISAACASVRLLGIELSSRSRSAGFRRMMSASE